MSFSSYGLFSFTIRPYQSQNAYDKVELGELEIQLNSCLVMFRSPIMLYEVVSELIC